jgi:hypothetical protein
MDIHKALNWLSFIVENCTDKERLADALKEHYYKLISTSKNIVVVVSEPSSPCPCGDCD